MRLQSFSDRIACDVNRMSNVALMTLSCAFLSLAIRSIDPARWSADKQAQLYDMQWFTHAFVPGGSAFVVFMCAVDIP